MTSSELRAYQRERRLKKWHEYIASLPTDPDDEPEQIQPPVELAPVVTYSRAELLYLWRSRLRFCGKDAASMLADFACTTVEEANILIAEFENESDLTSCSVQPETPPAASEPAEPVRNTTEPKKPVKRKRKFKARDTVEPPPPELTLLQVVLAESRERFCNRVVVLHLPLCNLYSVIVSKDRQLTTTYFSNADAALTYARKHRKLQYYQDISAAALSDYQL